MTRAVRNTGDVSGVGQGWGGGKPDVESCLSGCTRTASLLESAVTKAGRDTGDGGGVGHWWGGVRGVTPTLGKSLARVLLCDPVCL